MVLYDKNGLFLGIGNHELSFLGYEDIEEFRNYHSDFADLFVNKPGYIFKFRNFSWIDYTLHSGTPNRRAIIKTKNGREIETSLLISEIFLTSEMNGQKQLYGVEIVNSAFNKQSFESPLPASTETSAFSTSMELENNNNERLDTPASFSDAVSFPSINEESNGSLIGSYEDSFAPSESETVDQPLFTIDDDVPLFNASKPVEEPSEGFKLKINHFEDEDALPPSAPLSFDEPIATIEEPSLELPKADNDFTFDMPIKLKFEETREKVSESIEHPKSEDFDYDVFTCAEELGIEFNVLAQIVEEYIENLATSMPIVTRSFDNNDMQIAKQELVKLESVARHLRINLLTEDFDVLSSLANGETSSLVIAEKLEETQSHIQQFKDSFL